MRTLNYFHKALASFLFCADLPDCPAACWRRVSIRRRLQTHPPTVGRPITGTIPASATVALTQITPQNVSSLGLAWAFQTGQDSESEVIASCWSMACCTSPCRTTSGQSTRAPDIRSGATPIRRTRAFTSDIAALPCTRAGCTSSLPDAHLISLGRQKRQSPLERPDCRRRKGILVHHVTAGGARSRDRRRLAVTWITCPGFCGPSIPRPGRRSGSGTARRRSALQTQPREA